MIAFVREQQQHLLSIFERINNTYNHTTLHHASENHTSEHHASEHTNKIGRTKAKWRSWDRPGGGGGTMGVVRGEVIEKGACNVSEVYGQYPHIDENGPSTSSKPDRTGRPFFATGLSTIVHMYNPHAPIAHMNIRLFEVENEGFWFGGGADLTPFIAYDDDTEEFHHTFRQLCQDLHPDGDEAYKKYQKWCDEYFYIHHRQEVRGVGGIFFDHLRGDFEPLFAFVRGVCMEYIKVLDKILTRRCTHHFTEEQKEGQLHWRSRYVEFNLIYDRGTAFGLKSGGDLEAILVSLPPLVKW